VVQQTNNTTAFLRYINNLMTVILLIMVAGYFTWSENVGITRIIKVLSRVGMTGAVYWLYLKIVHYGAPASFKWKNGAAPFLYFLYLLLGLVSFLWSTNPGYSALQWVMDMESFVFAFYFIRSLFLLDTYFTGHTIRFYNLLGNVAFYLILVFIAGMILQPDVFFRKVEGGEDSRLGGYIMNPNELGMFCGLGISCLILHLKVKKNRWWTIIKILALVIALVATKSRSSLVGLLLIIFFHIRSTGNKKLITAVYLGVGALFPVMIENLIMRKGGIDDILSMTGRMPFWEALITEALPNEPILGFGFMRIYYTETFQGLHTYAGHMTHNTFIQVLMNLGFAGFFIVLLQLLFTIRGFLKEDKQRRLMLLGILIPVIINSFTEFGIFGETNYGILFFQLLVFQISTQINPLLTPVQKLVLKRKRPDLHCLFPPNGTSVCTVETNNRAGSINILSTSLLQSKQKTVQE